MYDYPNISQFIMKRRPTLSGYNSSWYVSVMSCHRWTVYTDVVQHRSLHYQPSVHTTQNVYTLAVLVVLLVVVVGEGGGGD